jgi:ureidoglycolate hydrolase
MALYIAHFQDEDSLTQELTAEASTKQQFTYEHDRWHFQLTMVQHCQSKHALYIADFQHEDSLTQQLTAEASTKE